MADPARRYATYADLMAVPGHLVAEIINGELVTHPRPATPHATASTNLTGELYGPFRKGIGGPGGWVILDEPELHLGPDVVVPDLAGWRRERMPETPVAPAIELPPDWVCEVLSPSTEATDRADKMPIYAHAGVKHAWLIDPELRTLEVFRLDAGGWRVVGTYRNNAKVRVEPFDAVELDLATLWER